MSNCCNPSWNHNWKATRENKMEGPKRNTRKTYLPSQVPNPISLQHWLEGTATCVNNDNLLSQESYITQACTPPKYIIPDTGCTGNYVPPSIKLNNITEDSICVRIPDARHIQSTHCGELSLLQSLTNTAARIVHRIPQLTQSLLSIRKLFYNDCVATFDKKHCNIHHNGKLILHGKQDKATTLWKIPLFTSEGETQYIPTSEDENIVCNLEQIATKKDIIHFLHASLFSPVKLTWLKAIKNERFVIWLGINTAYVAKHLTPTIATAKGHLYQKGKNISSTQKHTGEEKLDMTPSLEEKNEDVFIAFLAVDNNRAVYTDLTGKFPVTSMSGHKYIMVLYHYYSNGIMFWPVKNRSDIEAMRVYEDMYNYIKAHNWKPKLNIMENEVSIAVKRYIPNTNINYQLVAPNNHRNNTAERAIHTFKNHIVAGLSSVQPKFPMYLLDELLPQALITLNLLQTSRICPKISAYGHLHGTYNFDKTPLAPPGVRALIYNDPNHRVSYGVHDNEA